ncbi:MAG: hypothetical protein GY820_19630 [Gammaproteobacteria bacterium]|nr:hypothetical protein [Gammaproteobacteria bacterium]
MELKGQSFWAILTVPGANFLAVPFPDRNAGRVASQAEPVFGPAKIVYND